MPTHEPPLTPSPEATVLAPAGEPAGTFVAGPFHIPLRGWSDKGAVDENTLITVTKDGEAVNIAQHIWYNLHDGQPDNCPTAALSFSPPDFDPASRFPASSGVSSRITCAAWACATTTVCPRKGGGVLLNRWLPIRPDPPHLTQNNLTKHLGSLINGGSGRVKKLNATSIPIHLGNLAWFGDNKMASR